MWQTAPMACRAVPEGTPCRYPSRKSSTSASNSTTRHSACEPRRVSRRTCSSKWKPLKEHDAPGGAGQIVRGVHMRLHAGSHIDAPEHNVRGGTQIHQLPLELFIGEAIVADLRSKLPSKAITEKDLEKRLDNRIRKGDRLLLRTDHNNAYDGGSDKWMKASPYLTIGATMWCIEEGVVIVGYDF